MTKEFERVKYDIDNALSELRLERDMRTGSLTGSIVGKDNVYDGLILAIDRAIQLRIDELKNELATSERPQKAIGTRAIGTRGLFVHFIDLYGKRFAVHQSELVDAVCLGCDGAMAHLRKNQVQELVKVLQSWLETGSFKKASSNE